MDEPEVVLIGGAERRPIAIVDYDPAWPERFLRERGTIAAALRARARRIEHIGSTSVPGLGAKPIVDILVVVDDPEDDQLVEALEAAGYELRVREPGHRMFRTLARDAHVHCWAADSAEIRPYLLLRDFLRADADARCRYETEKRHLAPRDWADMNAYAVAKTPVVRELLARAEPWARSTGWRV